VTKTHIACYKSGFLNVSIATDLTYDLRTILDYKRDRKFHIQQ